MSAHAPQMGRRAAEAVGPRMNPGAAPVTEGDQAERRRAVPRVNSWTSPRVFTPVALVPRFPTRRHGLVLADFTGDSRAQA